MFAFWVFLIYRGIIKTMMPITKPEIRYFKCMVAIGKTKVSVIKTKVTTFSRVSRICGNKKP